MRIQDATEVFKILMKHQVHVTPMNWGVKGIGKSSFVKKAARDMGYRIFDIRLAQMESVDIKGMPFTAFIEMEVERSEIIRKVKRLRSVRSIRKELKEFLTEEELEGLTVANVNDYLKKLTEETYTQSSGVLHHYSPDWFVQALNEGKCIIFFDELNRANRETRQAIFEIILDRTLNFKKLRDDVFICGAGNPANGNYDANAMDDSALKGRFLHIKIEPHHDDWDAWANEYVDDAKMVKNIDSSIIAYLKKSPGSLFKYEDAMDTAALEIFIGFKITPDPRRWEFASKIVRAFDLVHCGANEYFKDENAKNSVLTEILSGVIGNDETIPYMRSRATFEKEILLSEIIEWSPETEARAYKYAGKVKPNGNEEKQEGMFSNKMRRGQIVASTETFEEGSEQATALATSVRADLIHRTTTDLMKNSMDMYKAENAVNIAKYISIQPSEVIQILVLDMGTMQAHLKHSLKTQPGNTVNIEGIDKIVDELKKYRVIDNLKSIREAINKEDEESRLKAEKLKAKDMLGSEFIVA